MEQELPDPHIDLAHPDSDRYLAPAITRISRDSPAREDTTSSRSGWQLHPARNGLHAIQPPISIN